MSPLNQRKKGTFLYDTVRNKVTYWGLSLLPMHGPKLAKPNRLSLPTSATPVRESYQFSFKSPKFLLFVPLEPFREMCLAHIVIFLLLMCFPNLLICFKNMREKPRNINLIQINEYSKLALPISYFVVLGFIKEGLVQQSNMQPNHK